MKIQSYFILFFLLGFLNIPKKEANIIQPNIIPKPIAMSEYAEKSK